MSDESSASSKMASDISQSLREKNELDDYVVILLTKDEAKDILRFLSEQYVTYENAGLWKLIHRLRSHDLES